MTPLPTAKSDQVYQQLKRWICCHEPPLNDRLVIRPLAQRFHVSATPVLQALQRLTDERLVIRVPRRGFFPALPDADHAREAYTAAYRYVAEGLAHRARPTRMPIARSLAETRTQAIRNGSNDAMIQAWESVLREAAGRGADPARLLQIENNVDYLARLRRIEGRLFPEQRRELLRMVRTYHDSKYQPFLRQFASHTRARSDHAETIVLRANGDGDGAR